MRMPDPYWPLFDLRIHDPSSTPFINPWTDVPVPRRHRESLQWWWSTRANWSPDNWSFTGAVFVDGVPAGVQDLTASNFAQLRTVKTGSWLGQQFQGPGLGKEIRFELDRATWASRRRDDIEIEGLAACLDMFGVDTPPG